MIVNCDCEHESQDKLHGKGRRVANPFKRNGVAYSRCTVCLKEKPIGKGNVNEKQKGKK